MNPSIRSLRPAFIAVAASVFATSGPSARAQTSATAKPDSDTATLSAFQVSTSQDKGYRASNSVSGSRFDTPIKDLPFALQAFTEDFIRDQHPVNIIDIAIYSPGVTFRSNDFTEGNVNLSVRGFESGSILRDGFKGPRLLDFANVTRLEVVKGPASFLYGQLAPGGVVNVITKSPTKTFQGSVGVNYGSYDEFGANLDVSGPVGETGFFYRLASSYSHDMEYWKPYDAHQNDVAPQILWQFAKNASLAIKYERFEKTETPQLMQYPGWGSFNGLLPTASDPNLATVPVFGLPDRFNSMATTDYRKSLSSNVTVMLNVKADDHWDIRGVYSDAKDSIASIFSGNLGVANGTYFQGRRWRGQNYAYSSDQFELQAIGKYAFNGVTLKLLAGAQYNPYAFENWAGQIANDPAFGPVGSPLPNWDLRDPSSGNRSIPASFTRDKLVTNSGSAITNYTDRGTYLGSTTGFFGDRVLVLAGLRRTTSQSQATQLTANGAPVNTAGPRFEVSRNTPQLGALFKVTAEVSAFASYSESFVPQPRNLNGYRKDTPAWTGYVKGPAQPTAGTGYDIGVKTDLLGGRVSGTLSYFSNENNNIINDVAELNPTSGVQFFENIQSGRQRARGVEADVTLSPMDNWQVYASASVMDAKILYFISPERDAFYRSVSDPTTLNAGDQNNFKNVYKFHGAPLQMSARRQYNVWTRYNFTGEFRGLYVGGGANYIGDQTIAPDAPSFAHQTYTLWNALLGYQTKIVGHATTFELNGKNLGKERYRPSQSSRGRPREFVFSVSTKF